MNVVQQRKRKFSATAAASPATAAPSNGRRRLSREAYIKKVKDETDAERRKTVRLEWYLKQLLLEKDMLIHENDSQFVQAMHSMAELDASLAALPAPVHSTVASPVAPVATTVAPMALSACPVPTPVASTATAATSAGAAVRPAASFDCRSFFDDDVADLDYDSIASPGPTSEQDDVADEAGFFASTASAPASACASPATTCTSPSAVYDEYATASPASSAFGDDQELGELAELVLPYTIFETLEESRPHLDTLFATSSSSCASSTTSASAGAASSLAPAAAAASCSWWDDDELSQFLAGPPSLLLA